MSSHHIVRENQEPALLITSFKVLDQELIGQLLEWSPTVFTDEDTVDFLLAEGIKVDFVIAPTERKFPQTQVKTIPLFRGIIEDTLRYLVEHRYGAVNMVCDKIPESIFAYSKYVNIVLFVEEKRYVLVRRKYEKWKQKGEKIHVREDQLKSMVGIAKIDKDCFLTEQDGFIYLEFNTDDFVLLGEEI